MNEFPLTRGRLAAWFQICMVVMIARRTDMNSLTALSARRYQHGVISIVQNGNSV